MKTKVHYHGRFYAVVNKITRRVIFRGRLTDLISVCGKDFFQLEYQRGFPCSCYHLEAETE